MGFLDGLTDSLFGSGDKTSSSSVNTAPRSAEEQALLDQLIISSNVPVKKTYTAKDFDRVALDNWALSNGYGKRNWTNTYLDPSTGKFIRPDALTEIAIAKSNQQAESDFAKAKTDIEAKNANQGKEVVLSEADKQIQNLFKTYVTNFLSTSVNGPSQESVDKAARYVDQIFTNPARDQINQGISDFTANQGAQAAALGRQTTDSTFQTNLFKNIANVNADLGVKRGAAISDVIQNQPARDLQTGLAGLSGISQTQQQNAFAPTFMNQLQQQAFNNRASLLNLLSGERQASAGHTQTQFAPDRGIMGNISQIGQGFSPLIANIAAPGSGGIASLAQGGGGMAAGGGGGFNLGNFAGKLG